MPRMTASVRSIPVAVALTAALMLLAVPVATAASEAAIAGPGPATHPFVELPKCEYQDIKTRLRGLKHWRKTLLDTNLKVGRAYRPRNLVSTSRAGVSGGGTVRKFVIDDLRAMVKAARNAGKRFKVRSAYRSYRYQLNTFNYWVNQVGLVKARKVSARPGHSEHQLGTTLDLQSAGTNKAPWNYDDWAKTKAGRWLKRHAWEYGFILSYPKGKASEVCYSYEPWHYRYVGRTMAKNVHDSGQTLRMYLWQNFESQ
jgi:D-alanyl-D-alanine carboxypeptidase